MWDYTFKALPGQPAGKVVLFEAGTVLSVKEVIERWKQATAFRLFFNNLLASAPFPAFFWENPPMHTLTLDKPFECVLLKSDSLPSVAADASPFSEYFNSEKEVVTFSSLRRDAQLIVPCPTGSITCYPHLAAFVREAPAGQRDAFWKTVGETYESRMHEKPTWLSTAGLGVSWLHVRIDLQPKYYRYSPYKKLSYV
jgi:hypothetical protein